ncbi:hypothetical protein G7046_g8170 [Stylonectria norvegica]|nr:hypothetical protein G7046_g8170 [Stylonectria norvegica]
MASLTFVTLELCASPSAHQWCLGWHRGTPPSKQWNLATCKVVFVIQCYGSDPDGSVGHLSILQLPSGWAARHTQTWVKVPDIGYLGAGLLLAEVYLVHRSPPNPAPRFDSWMRPVRSCESENWAIGPKPDVGVSVTVVQPQPAAYLADGNHLHADAQCRLKWDASSGYDGNIFCLWEGFLRLPPESIATWNTLPLNHFNFPLSSNFNPPSSTIILLIAGWCSKVANHKVKGNSNNPARRWRATAMSNETPIGAQTGALSEAQGEVPHISLAGGEGWIAGHLEALLKGNGWDVQTTTVRMEDREAVMRELTRVQPTHVLNAAGCTGRPNVDWCEDHKEATVRSNVIGALNLTDCCFVAGIHCTVFATGCIYQYDHAHPIGGPGYTEEDSPNFIGSFYSETKGHVEPIMKTYNNCLILRLRMPVSDDLHPRNFVTKILGYERVVDIPNSNTILYNLLPAAILMSARKVTGVYNFTNPGAISHNEVLTLFRDIVRPSLTFKNFTLEEQAKILKAGRSNCELETTKLVTKLKEYKYEVPEVHEAYRQCFMRMKAAGIR